MSRFLLTIAIALLGFVWVAPAHGMISCAYVLSDTATISTTDTITNTTVKVQYNYYTWACNDDGTWSSGGGDGYIPPSGGAPTSPDPPGIGLSGISDQNPEVPVLTIYKTASISSMKLYLGGTLFKTLSGSTTSVNLPSLRTMPHGKTIRLVGYTAQGLSVEANGSINVAGDVRSKSDRLLMDWWFETSGLSPELRTYEYLRSVDVLVGYTSYSGVSTFGQRTGRVQQHGVEDIIHYNSPNPSFGWESEYRMSSPRALNRFTEGICWVTMYDSHQHHSSHCAEMDEFTVAGTSSSSYIFGGMRAPATFGVLGPANIYQGQSITIGF